MTRRSLLAWTVLGLLLAGAATVHLLSTIPQAALGVDDANIFLTFGRNLANGHGFVYSPGGERVGGFTSLLWAVAAAAAWAVAPGRPEPLLCAANVALVAGTAGLLGASLRRIARDLANLPAAGVARLFPALSLLWLFASPAYVLWMTVPLMGQPSGASWSPESRLPPCGRRGLGPRDWTVATFCGLLVLTPLTRPEGLLLGPLALSLSAGLLLARDSGKAVLRRCAVPSALLAGSIFLLTGFRLAYFGHPVPNTFYAKVSPSLAHNLGEGLVYLASFLRATPVGMVSLGTALVVLGAAANRRWRRSPDSNDPSRLFEDQLAAVSVVVLVLVSLPVSPAAIIFQTTGSTSRPGPSWPCPRWASRPRSGDARATLAGFRSSERRGRGSRVSLA